jgi:hypothetical protein
MTISPAFLAPSLVKAVVDVGCRVESVSPACSLPSFTCQTDSPR